MGRIKEFEKETALDKAMILFWQKGYENTSLKELLLTMGILNGSFYNTFGNKENLYIEALRHYRQVITQERVSIFLNNKDFKKSLRLFFKEIFRCIRDKKIPNGCFLSNSLADEVLSKPRIKEFVFEEYNDFCNFFESTITKAQESGEVKNTTPAASLALILVTYIQGLFRLSNSHIKTKELELRSEEFLTSLQL